MYSIDEHDRVVEMSDVPQPESSASMPLIVCGERALYLGYRIGNLVEWEWGEEGPYALLTFQFTASHSFGSPNDEALHGHPLYERGLMAYGAYEVEHSSWIRQLERRNSVHSRHDPERFAQLHHYIFTFHDSTFECAAEGFELSLINSSKAIWWKMVDNLEW